MARIRDDYSAAALRRLAKMARTTAASRRMLSLALVLEGAKRADAAKAGGWIGKRLEIGFIASMLKGRKAFTASQARAL